MGSYSRGEAGSTAYYLFLWILHKLCHLDCTGQCPSPNPEAARRLSATVNPAHAGPRAVWVRLQHRCKVQAPDEEQTLQQQHLGGGGPENCRFSAPASVWSLVSSPVLMNSNRCDYILVMMVVVLSFQWPGSTWEERGGFSPGTLLHISRTSEHTFLRLEVSALLEVSPFLCCV